MEKNNDPINVFAENKCKKLILDSSMLVPIKAYKGSYNLTYPFVKPISKIF